MDSNSPIPPAARRLLDFIGLAETGRTGEAAYRTIIGYHESELAVPITSLTVDRLLSQQEKWPARGWITTAAGKYQILRSTLLELKDAMPLAGDEIFDATLQDRLGFALLLRCGWSEVGVGTMRRSAFALALAKEWAALPVLTAMRGHTIRLRRGQSYYAGDGRNAAIITPRDFERALDDALGPPRWRAFLFAFRRRRAGVRRVAG